MITIKDVAKEANISVTTVSRVLNNRGYISEETKEKVYAAMKRINYQPNEVARSLSKQSSNTIGVIVPHVSHPYFAELISNLESQAYKHGCKIFLFNSKEKNEKLKEYIEMCASSRVAGIILCSGNVLMDEVQSMGLPIVTIERFVETGLASVECDNYVGGGLAAEHLIQKGCKHLIYMGGVFQNEMPADERATGFIDKCKKYDVSHIEASTSMMQYNEMEYHSEIEEILLEHPEVDGIFASSDVIAAQTIQVCAKLGKRIPKDIKLVGFDDVLVSRLTSPQITTIHQPIKEMASLAVELLLKNKEDQVIPNRSILPVTLVERESTR